MSHAKPTSVATSVAISAALTPPLATVKPHKVKSPHGTRNDDYYWLRDDSRQNAEVLDYLKAENAYFRQYAARYKPLEDRLFAEIRGRIKEDDASVPWKKDSYWYYTRFEGGKEYAIHARKRGSLKAREEIMLDVNALAAGRDYYQIGGWDVSSGEQLLAYTEDTSGRRQYTVRFRNLATGETFPDAIPGVSAGVVWAADNRTLFYVENDPVTLLTKRVKRHVLGTDPLSDVVVYDEKDDSFYLDVDKTGSDRYLVISMSSTESDEMRVLRADNPTGRWRVFAGRRHKFHYDADHIGGTWIVSTDWDAPNYKLMRVAEADIGDRARWKPFVAHSKAVHINGFALFTQHFVIDERSDGLRRLRVVPWNGKTPQHGKASYIQSDEPAYTASLGANPEQDTDVLRYHYTSLTTPASVYELDMTTGRKKLLKRQPVLGGFDARRYVTERVWVKARDGTKVPVSLVYRKGFRRNGTAPLFQYAYGSYGLAMDPGFRSSVVSLLDRGFVFAIAHIRGGEEMGRAWYETGKKLDKKNSFNDFIDVTEALVAKGYGAKGKVFAQGASAGGLLMGAIVNMRPDLYRGVLAHVPFVDVVTSMLDPSIPLTTTEFDEWGDPRKKAFYDYMLSYSPYDNVTKQAYPALFVATGLHDSQVQYFEPAKWVAKLRATKTDGNPLVFKVNMEAGHGGKSGRFQQLREVAEEFAFVLDLLDVTE